ncbi:hypothetical protein EDB81DRAFT_771947 [Dactylonectria macrodidyma]|uniref:Rhodopsin domain-containing protein n=1 Tax=Dactylonectria macrodidyma TaxID=307937 RepID=A0A9P9FTU1_9HYPO|nr:hypothetical protein EDB81DRAFT_771947 [Dactylonectria macrodidyma]
MATSGLALTCLTSPAGWQKHGLGRHIWASPPEAMKVWEMGLFMAEFTYTLSLVFIKWSILAFYWRIFSTEFMIRMPIWILFGMVCAWGIAVILVAIYKCLPIYAVWERFDPVNPMPASDYTCGVDVYDSFVGNAIPNIITDVFLILLPLPYIWKMSCLRWAQKVAITGIFIVGIFVTVISVIRLIFVINLDLESPDIIWNPSDAVMWTGVEVNIATVCACLPSLKPILNLLMYGTVRPRSQSSGTSGINTIGGSAEAAKKRARPTPLGDSSCYVSCTRTRILNTGVIPGDVHPFAELADNDSDTYRAGLEAVELEYTGSQLRDDGSIGY